VIGIDASIWTVTVDVPHNDMMRSRSLLSELRAALRKLFNEIISHYTQSTVLHIFPAAPAAANVELGRVRMPKADMPWMIYDEQQPKGFQHALTIPPGA